MSARLLVQFIKYCLEYVRRRRLAQIGTNTRLGDTKVVGPENVRIGNHTSLGGRVYLYAVDRITIGDNCMIGWNTVITTATHDYRQVSMHGVVKRPVTIGNNVWLGLNVTILPGVEIADGVVVGAGSVVTRSINEPDIVVAGNPARRLRHRFEVAERQDTGLSSE